MRSSKSNDSSYKFYNSLQDISPLVQWATIDTEDRTFYSNPGLDIVGTLRALLADVHSGGAATQGGSGITQQLVKIAVLYDASKALQRKINEAIISVGMTETQAYDKNFILEMYLNTISYGDQNTGIEAAARNYFGLQPDPTDPVTGEDHHGQREARPRADGDPRRAAEQSDGVLSPPVHALLHEAAVYQGSMEQSVGARARRASRTLRASGRIRYAIGGR